MSRLSQTLSLVAGGVAVAAVVAVVINGVSPAAPPLPPICAQPASDGLSTLTGRAEAPSWDIPVVARDGTATVVGMCVDGLAAHPPAIRDGSVTLEAVGGFAESLEGVTGMMQYLVYPPAEADVVELVVAGREPSAVAFSPATAAPCPTVHSADVEVLACGWLLRGVWHTDVLGPEAPTLIDLLAEIDDVAAPAYVYGFEVRDDGIDIEFAVPMWDRGSDVTMRIDTLQRDFRVLEWTGRGETRLARSS